jgi:hypothetical protein
MHGGGRADGRTDGARQRPARTDARTAAPEHPRAVGTSRVRSGGLRRHLRDLTHTFALAA